MQVYHLWKAEWLLCKISILAESWKTVFLIKYTVQGRPPHQSLQLYVSLVDLAKAQRNGSILLLMNFAAQGSYKNPPSQYQYSWIQDTALQDTLESHLSPV